MNDMIDRIVIGNQTAWSAGDPLDPFRYAVDRGFDAFEWFSDKKIDEYGNAHGFSFADFDMALRTKLRATAERIGMRFAVHAPWQANPLRPEGQRHLIESLDFARDVGAVLTNLHLYMEEGSERYVDSLQSVIQHAATRGVLVSIENTPLTTPQEFNFVFDLIRQRGAGDCVGMCLDIGHANVCASTRNDFIRYIDELATHVPIIHCHVHENFGDCDAHMTLFTGPARENDAGVRLFLERMKARNYTGALILEQWPEPPSLLVEADRRLRGMLGFPEPGTRDASAAEVVSVASEAFADTPSASSVAVPASVSAAQTPLIEAIVKTNEEHQSWRGRLQWVRQKLAEAPERLSQNELAALVAYARFLSTGEVRCREDGGHYRPCHHAEEARQIEQALSTIETEENAWLVRKIYPCLPSHDDAFRRAEPLTRIRDIAHRNDIPHEMKQEIKHSLQNKLHRCAGPEDLVTSAKLLERITAPGVEYSREFVEEFKIFHEELREFFNAAGLEARLNALAGHVDGTIRRQIADFVAQKQQCNGQPDVLLKSLTDLRERMATETGMQAFSEANGEALRQQLRMTDIAMEDYAFSLLSEAANRLGESENDWPRLFDMFLAALKHVRRSRIESDECEALLVDLDAWRNGFIPSEKPQMLRLKAVLERMRRVAEGYADRVANVLQPPVATLGRKLRVAEHAIGVFCEADIRANVVFQLSKLVEHGLKVIRRRLDLPPWEVVVPGEGDGELVRMDALEKAENCKAPCVALLERAEGNEEIPTAVRGIILAHAIPHLSHLGVRARQAGVPFAACDDPAHFESLCGLLGKGVRFRLRPETLALEEGTFSSRGSSSSIHAVMIPRAKAASAVTIVTLDAVEASTCGAKSAGARVLCDLAERSQGLFRAPDALVIPFGVMELLLAEAPDTKREYARLVATVENASLAELRDPLTALQVLLAGLSVPEAIVAAVEQHFGSDSLLAVRSSANGEDLEAMAGAGLYESVVGVKPNEVAAAIARVWASLWTRRATISRRQAGIPQDAICMAVLIQEMIDANISFIMHTTDHISGHNDRASVELAAGLGEVLASASLPGAPYRLECERATGQATIRSFANFSFALRHGERGNLRRERLRYAEVPLTADLSVYPALGKRLATIAEFMENELQGPQDIEGVLVGEEIYLVQTRAQQGLTSE